jgi:hypothetical protein
MTSIVSIVATFMATFMLVFGYLTYSDDGQTETPAAAAAADSALGG